MTAMTRAEREDLQRLVRQRERVWAKAAAAANREVKKAQAQVAARCHEFGIPERFAPDLSVEWHHRGYGNQIDSRKAELRRMAQTQIAALEQKAIVEIKVSCLDAQTKLATAGCASEASKPFADALPSVERLMRPLSLAAIAGEADPPIAEQLVSPNALRQRRVTARGRYVTPPVTLPTPRITSTGRKRGNRQRRRLKYRRNFRNGKVGTALRVEVGPPSDGSPAGPAIISK